MYRIFDRAYDRPGNPERPHDEVYPEQDEIEREESDDEWMDEEESDDMI